MMLKKAISIAVHLLTASGVVIGLWALLLIMQEDADNALRLLALAAVIDAVDGTLARKFDIKRHMPDIDGGLIDNLVDYLTWVFIPMVWAWSFLGIPFAVCAVVLLSSVIGFAHTRAKTPDHFFRGFPSYWNVVILYLFLLEADAVISSIILILLAVLVLMPVKFVYPSRTPTLQKTTLLLALPYIIMLGIMLLFFGDTPRWLVLLSLYYPVYYTGLSLYLSRR